MPKIFLKIQSGFTFNELLITLAMIVILILIALPTYQDAILKIRRAEAKSALHTVMLQQESFYTQHHTYSAFSSKTKHSPFKQWSGDSPEKSYYEISAAPCPGRQLNQCVLLTASSNAANGKHVDDPVCGNFMLDSANNKSYSNGTEPNSLCW